MHNNWNKWIGCEFDKEYYIDLANTLAKIRAKSVDVYPRQSDVFAAFANDPLKTRVCILGQDPYIRPGQAHGYSFSVPPGMPTPPSLRNILKEIQADIPQAKIDLNYGCLDRWSKQGVLLLNNVLTVEAGKSNSHKKLGWENFTEAAIKELSENTKGIVFMLWGNNARRRASLIDQSKHLVLEAAHPSGLSAYRGFFGCRHFSKANMFLESLGKPPIDWSNV